MKRIIRLTESDLTRIVRRVINESEEDMIRIPRKFSGIRSELGSKSSPQDIIDMYNEVVASEGESVPLEKYEEGMFYNEDDQEIPTDVILDELNYAIVGEEEDYDEEDFSSLRNIEEDDDDDDGGYYTFDFGGPKDSTALISDIVELIENSEDVNDFKMKIKKYTKNNQEDFNKLSLVKRDEIDRFINSVITRHDF